jgi:LemA protein
VSERYPELRATESFRDLQTQLEGTENRVAVARRRFIDAVAAYNTTVQTFPSMIGAKMRGRGVRPTFTGAPADATPPEVKF